MKRSFVMPHALVNVFYDYVNTDSHDRNNAFDILLFRHPIRSSSGEHERTMVVATYKPGADALLTKAFYKALGFKYRIDRTGEEEIIIRL